MDAQPASSPVPPTAAPRGAAGNVALWFGLLAAPLAWMTGSLAAYFIASQSCTMKPAVAAALATATSPRFIGLIGAAFAIAVAGLVVAYGNWRKMRREGRGSNHHRLQLGEERARFLSLCGLLVSIGFCIAFLFTAAYMVAAPLCGK
jgi:hypothetical protein